MRQTCTPPPRLATDTTAVPRKAHGTHVVIEERSTGWHSAITPRISGQIR
jgi:hypothetical protein